MLKVFPNKRKKTQTSSNRTNKEASPEYQERHPDVFIFAFLMTKYKSKTSPTDFSHLIRREERKGRRVGG